MGKYVYSRKDTPKRLGAYVYDIPVHTPVLNLLAFFGHAKGSAATIATQHFASDVVTFMQGCYV